MRGALVVGLIACSAPAPVAPVPKAAALDAWVIGQLGPIADAEVRVVSLTKQTCACPAPVDDALWPECSCPASYATWRERAAQCKWPAPATRVLRSDSRGYVPLDVRALGMNVEATTRTGAQWIAAPARTDKLALEVGRALTYRFIMNTSAELRAVLLFDDGHCMPLQRRGAKQWTTLAPVPRVEAESILVVEAAGFAPYVTAMSDSDGDHDIFIELHTSAPVTGTCNGDRVELVNPLQRISQRLGTGHHFSLDGAIDATSTVTCYRGADAVKEWSYSPADGLEESANNGGGLNLGACTDVDVVDRAGRPIEKAEITFDADPDASPSTSATSYAGAGGRACIEDVEPGGDLIVHAPLDMGGSCAGEAKLRVTQQLIGKPIRVVLDMQRFDRRRFRGRVLSPEKIPVVGAVVRIDQLDPAENQDCSERSDSIVSTAADGVFELPLLPRGTAKVTIQHDWYAEQSVELAIPGHEREVTLSRGVTWTGRVLGPDGKKIDACNLAVLLAGGRTVYSRCTPDGFTFTTLVPGNAMLQVRLSDEDPLGHLRVIQTNITITAQMHGHDVRWPAGESIRGRVVDARGTPIAGVYVRALPKGQANLPAGIEPGEVIVVTDAQGRFELRHLEHGMWHLDNVFSRSTELDVATGTKNVELVSERPR